MSVWDVERMAAEITPPVQGATVAVNCNTTPQVIDLCSFPSANLVPNQPDKKNPVGHYVRITADSNAIYFAFGSNITTLKNLSTTSYTTVNATTGAVTVTSNECSVVPGGSWKDFRVIPGITPQVKNPIGADSPCRYIALLTATGTSIARIEQSSS